MVRKTDIRRDSEPRSHQLFGDEDQKAELEARNGLLQFDEVIRLVGAVERGASFRLRPSTLQTLHRIAIQDIDTCAGNYRTSSGGAAAQPLRSASPLPTYAPAPETYRMDSVRQNWCGLTVVLGYPAA
jgi:hypothetical protein